MALTPAIQEIRDLDTDSEDEGAVMSSDIAEYMKGLGVSDPWKQCLQNDSSQEIHPSINTDHILKKRNDPEAIFDIMALEASRKRASCPDFADIRNILPLFFDQKSRDDDVKPAKEAATGQLNEEENIQGIGCASKMKGHGARESSAKRLPGRDESSASNQCRPPGPRRNKVNNDRPGSGKQAPCAAVSCPSRLINRCGKRKHQRRRRDGSAEVGEVVSGMAAGVWIERGALGSNGSGRAGSGRGGRPDPSKNNAVASRPPGDAGPLGAAAGAGRASGEPGAGNGLKNRQEMTLVRGQGGHAAGGVPDAGNRAPEMTSTQIRSGPDSTRSGRDDPLHRGGETANGSHRTGGMPHEDKCMNVNSVEEDILRAASEGDLDALKEDLDSRFSGDKVEHVTDIRGNTALHRAVIGGQLSCVQLLVGKWPHLVRIENRSKETPVHLSIQHGHIEILDWFLDNSTIDTERESRATTRKSLLHQAAKRGQDGCLRLLLERIPGIQRCTDKYGNTAAHLAAKHGNLTCLQTLVEFGLDVTQPNDDGHSPCYCADFANHRQCAGYLLAVESCRCLAERAIQLHLRLKRYEGEQNGMTSPPSSIQDGSLSEKDGATGPPPGRVWALVRHQFKKLERQLLVYRTQSSDVTTRCLRGRQPSVEAAREDARRASSIQSGSASDRDRAGSGSSTATGRDPDETRRFSPEKIKRLYSGLWALRRSFERHGAGLGDERRDASSARSEKATPTCAKVQPMPRSSQARRAGSSDAIAASPTSDRRTRRGRAEARAPPCPQGGATSPAGSPPRRLSIGGQAAAGSWRGGDDSSRTVRRQHCPQVQLKRVLTADAKTTNNILRSFGWHGLDYYLQRRCSRNREKESKPIDGAMTDPEMGSSFRSGTSVQSNGHVMTTATKDAERVVRRNHNVPMSTRATYEGRHDVQAVPTSPQDRCIQPPATVPNWRSPPVPRQGMKLPSFHQSHKSLSRSNKKTGMFFSEESDSFSSDNAKSFYEPSIRERRQRAWFAGVRPRVCQPVHGVQRTAYSHVTDDDVTSSCASDNDFGKDSEAKPKAGTTKPRGTSGSRSGSSAEVAQTMSRNDARASRPAEEGGESRLNRTRTFGEPRRDHATAGGSCPPGYDGIPSPERFFLGPRANRGASTSNPDTRQEGAAWRTNELSGLRFESGRGERRPDTEWSQQKLEHHNLPIDCHQMTLAPEHGKQDRKETAAAAMEWQRQDKQGMSPSPKGYHHRPGGTYVTKGARSAYQDHYTLL